MHLQVEISVAEDVGKGCTGVVGFLEVLKDFRRLSVVVEEVGKGCSYRV